MEDVRCYQIGNSAIKFEDSINFDSMGCIMDLIEIMLPNIDQENGLTIYWNSVGGAVHDLADFTDFIYGLPDDLNIRFVINGYAFSGGAFMIYDLIDRCAMQIADGASIMFHTALLDSRSRNERENKTNDKTIEMFTSRYIEIFKASNWDTKDIDDFRSGFDVYITGGQMMDYLGNYIAYLTEENTKAVNEDLIAEVYARGLENNFIKTLDKTE